MVHEPPLVLAVETSAPGGGVALMRGDDPLAALPLGDGQRRAQNLLPAARDLFAAAPGGPTPADLAFVAVSRGPGSYTGTRLGVMAAKALAYGLGVPVVGVSSLAALALDAFAAPDAFAPLDPRAAGASDWSDWSGADRPTRAAVVRVARRDEVLLGLYATDSASASTPVIPLADDRALTPDEAVLRLRAAMDESGAAVWLLVGDGVAAHADVWRALPADRLRIVRAPSNPTEPGEANDARKEIGGEGGGGPSWSAATARSVGRLAWARWRAGERDDPLALQPVYLRRDGDPGWRVDALITP